MNDTTKRQLVTVITVLFVLFAGCTGFFGGSTETPTERSDEQQPGMETRSPTKTAEDTPRPTDSTRINNFTRETTGQILLTLSEIAPVYDLTGERYLTRETANEEVADQLRQDALLVRHERTFQSTSEDEASPSIIFASVSVYESTAAAKQGQRVLLDQAVPDDATRRTVTLLAEFNATKVRYETDKFRNVLIIRQSESSVYYVVTSDQEEYTRDTAQELFIKMLQDLP